MGWLLPLIGLVLLLAGGGGAALLLLPRRAPAHPVEVLAVSVVLGSLLVAASSFAFGFVVHGLPLQLGVGLTCVGVAGLGARFGAAVYVARPSGWRWLIPLVVFLAGLGVLVWLGGLWTLGWDALVDWEFKARAAAFNGGAVPLAYYVDQGTQWSHPEYPLLLPLAEAWLFVWAGQPDERLVRLVFAVFDAALLAELYVLGARFGRSRWHGTLAMVLALFVPQLMVGFGSGTTAWTDYLVALIYLMAGGYLLQAAICETPELFRLVSVLCIALVWTKQEGVFLWLTLVLATALLPHRHRVRATALVMLPALAVAVGWRLFIHALGVPPTFDFLPLTASTLWANLDRVPALVAWLASKMTDGATWGLLWAGLALSIVLPDRWKRRQQLLLGLLVLAPLVPDLLSFVFSAWTPYMTHVDSSMPRLMEQVAALGVLAIASAAPGLPGQGAQSLSERVGPVEPRHGPE